MCYAFNIPVLDFHIRGGGGGNQLIVGTEIWDENLIG